MRGKTPETDPFPPGRALNPGIFYRTVFDRAYLSRANRILPDGAGGTDAGAELDSLYAGSGATLVNPAINPVNVAMTRFRRPHEGTMIFTGFDLWSFRRADCQDLVDFVL